MSTEIIIGDLVKVKNVALVALSKTLNKAVDKIKDNTYEVFAIAKSDRVRYCLIDVKSNNPTVFKAQKRNLEIVSRAKLQFNADSSIEEALSFNSFGSSFYDKIKGLDVRDTDKNYFSFVIQDGTPYIEYIPVNKFQEFNFDYYNKDLRAKYGKRARPIKVLLEIYKTKYDDLPQPEIDSLLACLNKEISADFKIVSGKDITKYYSETNYSSNGIGTLWNSCMRYDVLGRRGAFKLYEENARMLILQEKDGKILGRAIIWDLHGDRFEGRVFLDRIYTTNDAFVGLFTQYAEKNNWIHLKAQTYGEYTFVDKGEIIELSSDDNVYVEIKNELNPYTAYPYIDTFFVQNCRCKTTANRLYVSKYMDVIDDYNDAFITYHNTGGSRMPHNFKDGECLQGGR